MTTQEAFVNNVESEIKLHVLRSLISDYIVHIFILDYN